MWGWALELLLPESTKRIIKHTKAHRMSNHKHVHMYKTADIELIIFEASVYLTCQYWCIFKPTPKNWVDVSFVVKWQTTSAKGPAVLFLRLTLLKPEWNTDFRPTNWWSECQLRAIVETQDLLDKSFITEFKIIFIHFFKINDDLTFWTIFLTTFQDKNNKKTILPSYSSSQLVLSSESSVHGVSAIKYLDESI